AKCAKWQADWQCLRPIYTASNALLWKRWRARSSTWNKTKHYSKENLMEAKRGHGKRKYENTMPVIEEGWWESVLAEERLYTRPAPNTAKPKPAVPSKAE